MHWTVDPAIAGSSPVRVAPFGDMIVDVIIDVMQDAGSTPAASTYQTKGA